MALPDWIGFIADQVPPAWVGKANAWLNELTDKVNALDTTTLWTPAMTQGVAVGATVTVAEYTRQGDSLDGYVHMTATGAGTAANNILVSTPITMAPVATQAAGSGFFFKGGVTYPIHVYLASATTFGFFHSHALSSFLGTGVFAGAVGAGDILSFQFTYGV